MSTRQGEATAKKNRKGAVWAIISPIKKQVIQAGVLAVLSVVTSVIFLVLLILTLQGYVQEGVFSWLYGAGIIICALLSFVFMGLAFKVSHLAMFRLEFVLRKDLLFRLTRMPIGVVNRFGAGALSKIIGDDVHSLHVLVADGIPLYARVYVAPVLMIGVMFFFNWQYALVAMCFAAVLLGVMFFFMVRSNAAAPEYEAVKEDLNESIIEFFQAMPIVRTFDDGDISFSRYKSALERHTKWLSNWYMSCGVGSRISLVIWNPIIFLIVLLWTGLFFYARDSLSFTHWVAILLCALTLTDMFMNLMSLMHLMLQAQISAERILDLQEIHLLPVAQELKEPKGLDIEFKHVGFTYPNRSQKALENINLYIKEGQWVAVVGESGSGKTTMAKLIPRFWDVTEGQILLGGVDIRDIDPESLMQKIAFVFQDNFLFSGTIAENIALGLENTPREAIEQAARVAQIHDFIMTLPHGYDTSINERGVSLSGGQRQRITIARAVLQNRPILILDEATAFADAENEYLVMKAMFELMKGKTVFMVAHRLPTIQNADHILVLSKGLCIEQGNHQDLLNQKGVYAGLWSSYLEARDWKVRADKSQCDQGEDHE